jgi:type I site-specific restriction endonuclease
MDFKSFSEQETRYNLINPLAKAEWYLSDRSQIWFEVPVEGYDASQQSGITDYCLFRTNCEMLAVIEAINDFN